MTRVKPSKGGSKREQADAKRKLAAVRAVVVTKHGAEAWAAIEDDTDAKKHLEMVAGLSEELAVHFAMHARALRDGDGAVDKKQIERDVLDFHALVFLTKAKGKASVSRRTALRERIDEAAQAVKELGAAQRPAAVAALATAILAAQRRDDPGNSGRLGLLMPSIKTLILQTAEAKPGRPRTGETSLRKSWSALFEGLDYPNPAETGNGLRNAARRNKPRTG